MIAVRVRQLESSSRVHRCILSARRGATEIVHRAERRQRGRVERGEGEKIRGGSYELRRKTVDYVCLTPLPLPKGPELCLSTKSKLRLGGDVRRFVRIRKEAAPPVNRLFCPDFRADRSQFLRHRSSSLFYYLATFFKKRSNDGGPFFSLFSSLLLLREREKLFSKFRKIFKE